MLFRSLFSMYIMYQNGTDSIIIGVSITIFFHIKLQNRISDKYIVLVHVRYFYFFYSLQIAIGPWYRIDGDDSNNLVLMYDLDLILIIIFFPLIRVDTAYRPIMLIVTIINGSC